VLYLPATNGQPTYVPTITPLAGYVLVVLDILDFKFWAYINGQWVDLAQGDATAAQNAAISQAQTLANAAQTNAISQAQTLANTAQANAISQAQTLANTAQSGAASQAQTYANTAQANAIAAAKTYTDQQVASITISKYTVSTLPANPQNGWLAFATDGLNSGQSSGSGTGCLVSGNKNSQWIAVWSGAPVAS